MVANATSQNKDSVWELKLHYLSHFQYVYLGIYIEDGMEIFDLHGEPRIKADNIHLPLLYHVLVTYPI